MGVSEAWRAAQDRLRHRIWAARADGDRPASEPVPPPLSAPLQPPELVTPAIASHRGLAGRPIRLVKRVLHRLLVPLVFAPQADFNVRVAARLNQAGWSGEGQPNIQDIADEVAQLRGELLALRAELQSQQVLLEKVRNAGASEAGDGAGTGAA